MKRLLPAIILALTAHVLLLGLKFDRPSRVSHPSLKRSPLSVTLTYHHPRESRSEPVDIKPEIPNIIHVLPKKKTKKKKTKPELKVEPIKDHLKAVVKEIKTPLDAGERKVEEKHEDSTDKKAPGLVAMSVGVSRVMKVREAMPLYRLNPPPEYPVLAKKRGYQGTVVLEVLVDLNGRVSDLLVFKSSGYSALDRKASESVKKWLFEPGMRGNRRVKMWVRVPIRFQLN